MGEFEKEVITRLTRIETKIEDYKQIEKNADEALSLSKQNEKDIHEIRDNTKWLWRTLLGSVILFIFNILKEMFKW